MSTRWSPGRRYTRELRRAVISAKRLDPAWSNLARGREGGREGGEGGEGREGRGGQGRAGQGRAGQDRAGQGRGGEGRGGEGRGGEGTVHNFHKPEPLWPRSLAGHPLRGWPASYTLIHRHMTYGIQACGNWTSITKLGVLQKRVIRIINKKRYRSHTDPIFKSESTLNISDLYKLHVSLFMFDLKNGSLPISFKTHIQQSETATHNTLCTRPHGLLKKERARTTFSSKLPKHNFTNIWNNISENIRNVANRRLFKCMLHKYYADQYESLVICTNPICPDCRSRR